MREFPTRVGEDLGPHREFHRSGQGGDSADFSRANRILYFSEKGPAANATLAYWPVAVRGELSAELRGSARYFLGS